MWFNSLLYHNVQFFDQNLDMMRSHKLKMCIGLTSLVEFSSLQSLSDGWNCEVSVGGWSWGLNVSVYSGLGVVRWRGFGLPVDWDRLGKQPKPRGAHDSDRPQARPRIAHSPRLSGCACIPWPLFSLIIKMLQAGNKSQVVKSFFLSSFFPEQIMWYVCFGLLQFFSTFQLFDPDMHIFKKKERKATFPAR